MDWRFPIEWRGPVLLELPDAARRLIPIELWHLAVHQDHVVMNASQCLQDFISVRDGVGAIAEFLQQTYGYLLVYGVILGQEDAQSRSSGSWDTCRRKNFRCLAG